jgi:hypothetical protein
MIWRPWIRSARDDLAAVLRLAARPLLEAQQHAWESGGHPGTLLAGAVTRSLLNALLAGGVLTSVPRRPVNGW